MSERASVTITHQVLEQGGKYVAEVAGETHRGHLEWEPALDQEGGAVRIATHTIVPRPIGGRGVAAQLVERLIADARQLGFKVDPQCSYVEKKFEDNPDWADLRI